MIRLNCLGVGRWGPNLVRNFVNRPDTEIGMVGDLDPDRLKLVKSRIPSVETSTDIEAVIADPRSDALIVATPFRTHYALTKQALMLGKHVLVEKPLCETVEECEELNVLAEAQGLILAVGHVFLFNAGIQMLRTTIQSGELGRIRDVHATRTNLGPHRRDANALWDLVSHDLSIFEYWFDTTPVGVTARGGTYVSEDVEDVVVGTYVYDDDMMACFHASWLNPRKVREITVVGEQKMATWNDMDLMEPVRIYDKSMVMQGAADYTDTQGAFIARTRDGDIHIPKVGGSEPLAAECNHFIECIQEGKRPVNDAAMAARIVRELIAADQSLGAGGDRVAIDATDRSRPGERKRSWERLAGTRNLSELRNATLQ